MALHSEGSLKWAGSGGERLAEAASGLPGVGSALTEHATAEWRESKGGNEKLVAIQLEPRAPFDGEQTRRAREEGLEKQREGKEETFGRRRVKTYTDIFLPFLKRFLFKTYLT